jgi:hypothetical protein
MLAALPEFSSIYGRRPIRDNKGGMRAPHCFATWFMLRKLQPTAVMESGLWRGQGTWLIEQACPDADLYCIDIDLGRLEYRSPRATYFDRDFRKGDWSALARESTVLFFDDHQDAVKRTKMARALRFRHLIFEDNYPTGRGDCRSLKQVLSRSWLFGGGVRDALAVYSEFPPVYQAERTRWGDPWDDRYPTPPSLLQQLTEPWQQCFFDEAQAYTWMCYARLK